MSPLTAKITARVIAKFRKHLQSNAYLMTCLVNLRGKDPACWCAPRARHANVLLELANK